MGKSHINKNKNVQHNLKYGIWVKPFSAIEIGKLKTNSISCISTQNHKKFFFDKCCSIFELALLGLFQMMKY